MFGNTEPSTLPHIFVLGWWCEGLDGEKVKQSLVVEPTTLHLSHILYWGEGWGTGK